MGEIISRYQQLLSLRVSQILKSFFIKTEKFWDRILMVNLAPSFAELRHLRIN